MELKTLLLVVIFLFQLSLALDFEENPTFLDPGKYFAKIQHKKERRPGPGSLHGSASSYGSTKKRNKLKYTFLQPKDSSTVTKKGEECQQPVGAFNAFTFMNFALAAATLAGNLVANVNSNNRNNNNNNNNNNLNSQNINLNSNNNAGNNNNAIMVPAGRKKRHANPQAKTLSNIRKYLVSNTYDSTIDNLLDELMPHVTQFPLECSI